MDEIAITWGSGSGSSNPHYVGIDYSLSGTSLTVRYYVRATYPVQDNQTLTLKNAITGSVDFFKDGPAQVLVATRTRSVAYGSSYTVRAELSGVYNGGTPYHQRTISVPARAPGTPAKPVVDQITSRSMHASTNPAPASNGSTITAYGWDIEPGSSEILTSNGRNWYRSGLTPGTQYRVRVWAQNAAGRSPWSAWSNYFTTDAEPPNAPSSSVSVSGHVGTLSWTAPGTHGTPVTGYQVQIASNSSFTSNALSDTVGASVRSYPMDNRAAHMEPGSTWYVRVRANSAAGYGAWSTTRSYTIPAEPPDAPPSTSATVSSGSGVLSWGAAATNGTPVTGYNVQIASNSAFTENLSQTTVSASVRSYRFDNQAQHMVPGSTWYVRVRANSSAGYGSFGTQRSFTIPAEPPDAPLNVTLVPDEDRNLVLSWDAPGTNGTPITGYEIHVSTSASFPSGSVQTYTRTAGTDEFIYTDGVTGTTYYMRVRALSAAGPGPWVYANAMVQGGMWGNVGGTWMPGKRLWANVGGTWMVTRPYGKISGTWEG